MQLGHKMRLGEFQEINIAILSPLQSIAWWNIVIAWFQNPHQWSIVYWLYDLNNPSTSDYPDMYMVIRSFIAFVKVSFFSVFIFAPDDVDKLVDCRWRENN